MQISVCCAQTGRACGHCLSKKLEWLVSSTRRFRLWVERIITSSGFAARIKIAKQDTYRPYIPAWRDQHPPRSTCRSVAARTGQTGPHPPLPNVDEWQGIEVHQPTSMPTHRTTFKPLASGTSLSPMNRIESNRMNQLLLSFCGGGGTDQNGELMSRRHQAWACARLG